MSSTVSRAESAIAHAVTPEPVVPYAISLRRLVRSARLTSAQAALVALDVWRAAGDLRPAGTGNGTAHLDAVRLDEQGNATLTSATSLTSVLSALCGCLGGPPDELRGVLAEVEATADRAAFERLADAVAPVEQSTRLELGALVRASTDTQPGASAHLPVPEGRQAQPPWTPPPTPGLGRRIWHYAWRPLAGLLVFAVVVGFELTSLRTQLERDLGRLGGVPNVRLSHSSTVPTTSAPSLGPAASGAVRGVTVRSEQLCHPGASCPLAVSIQVRPAHKATAVSWSVQVVDACRAAAPVTRHGGTVHIRPGASRVVVVHSVRLPRGSALDVYAVTARPATVASSPLQIPAAKPGTPRC